MEQTDYDYMDNLTLDGWAWEIFRRSKRYRSHINDLVQLIPIFNNTRPEEEGRGSLWAIIRNSIRDLYESAGISLSRFDEGQDDPKTHIIHNDGREIIGIPKPEIRYCDFDIKLRPQFLCVSPVVVREFDKVNYSDDPLNPFSPAALVELSPHFSIKSVRDTIYVGISRRAGLNEVLEALRPQLKQYLDNHNRRTPSKWKYYLIAYDLKEADPSITYERIADILCDAYPDVKDGNGNNITFSARNCSYYHKKARGLIEGEDMRKQLQKYI